MTYFPLLRGKQYELLALREYLSQGLPASQVIPVIEPVKEPLNGLRLCLDALRSSQQQHIVIGNPLVGDMASPNHFHESLAELFSPTEALNLGDCILGLLITDQTDINELLKSIEHLPPEVKLALIHKKRSPDLETLEAGTRVRRRFDFIDSQLRRRRFGESLKHSAGVTLQDDFEQAARNADYLDRPVSTFSEEHLYYVQEGWTGFSDYLTIGEAYQEGGFSPRAVAIHWTYSLSADEPIMIRHFTSESNFDPANVAGKFLEAADKLTDFLNANDIDTYASNVIREHTANRTYPGLGTVKKLSILNHMEVVARILE